MTELQPIIVFHGYHFVRHLGIRNRICVKLLQLMYAENAHNDELFNHFINKRIPEFWKSWASKFHQNVTKDVYINGSNNENVV